jgi:hypothetical protein
MPIRRYLTKKNGYYLSLDKHYFSIFFLYNTSDSSTRTSNPHFIFNRICTDDTVFNLVQRMNKNLENNYDHRRYNEAGKPGLDSRQGQEIYLFSTVLIPALGFYPSELRHPERETDHFYLVPRSRIPYGVVLNYT